MTRPARPARVVAYRPEHWDEVVRLARFFSEWVFRGVSSRKYRLRPSIERTAERYSFPSHELPVREKKILEEFQRAAHLHFPAHELPDEEDWMAWISLVQHYGGPSRALDFTTSFYCAAFFALQETAETASIWAVNGPELERNAAKKLDVTTAGRTVNAVRKDLIRKLNDAVGQVNGPTVACPYFPNRLHQRLAHQQGLFIVSGRVDVTLERQLLETLEVSTAQLSRAVRAPRETVEAHPDLTAVGALRVVKIEIVPALHRKAREELARMNLTSASLFPGPDGYATALHWKLGDRQPGEPDFVPQNAATGRLLGRGRGQAGRPRRRRHRREA